MNCAAPPPILRLLLPLIAVGLLFSCAPRELSSFAWVSSEGKPLSFHQEFSFEEGKEQLFDREATKNRYILAEASAIPPGFMLAVTLDIESEGTVVEFSLYSDLRKPLRTSRFSGAAGRSSFYLSSGAVSLKALGLTVTPPAGGGAAESEQAIRTAALVSVEVLPEFHGYEYREKGASRISDDVRVERGSGAVSWYLPIPAASQAAGQTLTLSYGSASGAEILIRGARSLKLLCSSTRGQTRIPLSVLTEGSPVESLVLSVSDSAGLVSAFVEALPPRDAATVDPGILLQKPRLGEDEDFSLHYWELIPEVLMFDFRDYAVQDAYLKRLAFFVEKQGFTGRLAEDAEIAELHGWNAHDYRAEDVARFFTLAETSKFSLGEEEILLRDLLLREGFLIASGNGFKGNGGALISISRESPDYLRKTFLTHEASHAIFFTDASYRKLVLSIWNDMSKEEKSFWYRYFGWMRYNTGSDYLMANELQAYLIQQSPVHAQKYFTETLVGRLVEAHPELEEPLSEYVLAFGGEFTEKAGELDAWLRAAYGFGAGATYFVR